MTRYVPSRLLPAQAYIPGKTARSRAQASPSTGDMQETLDAATWDRCELYLWGFDLLAGGFPWEAHEAWERLWRGLQRGSAEALLLQALIKLAAALVKGAQRKSGGVRVHAEGAAALLRKVSVAIAPASVLMGVDLREVAACADALPTGPVATLSIELVGARHAGGA